MDIKELVDQFNDRGYVIIPELLTTSEATELHGALEELAPPHDPAKAIVKHTERALLPNVSFFGVLTKDRLLEVVQGVIGDDFQLLAYDALDTKPNSGLERNWHTDVQFWSDTTLTANVAIYLQDMTPDEGPLLVIPGSHRRGRGPRDDERLAKSAEEVPVSVAAGSAVVFDAQLWHSGGRNASPRPRRVIFPYFGHYWIKRMDEFYRTPLPDYILEHEDPVVQQLFGRRLRGQSVYGGYDENSYR